MPMLFRLYNHVKVFHKLHFVIVLYYSIVSDAASNVSHVVTDVKDDLVFRSAFSTSHDYGISRELALGDMAHHVLIFDIYNKRGIMYRAFCAGSIITLERVLTSSHCFLTNRKRYKRNLTEVKVVAGVLTTALAEPVSDDDKAMQWRSIIKVYSQQKYRFPAYDLCVLVMSKPWKFNTSVNKIPYASIDFNYDGICVSTSVKSTTSWSFSKSIFREHQHIIKRQECEDMLLKDTSLYYCTVSITNNPSMPSETKGGGLVCHRTLDPNEVDDQQGILVGVNSLINIALPSLHNRIAPHNQWVTDTSCVLESDGFMLVVAFAVKLL